MFGQKHFIYKYCLRLNSFLVKLRDFLMFFLVLYKKFFMLKDIYFPFLPQNN